MSEKGKQAQGCQPSELPLVEAALRRAARMARERAARHGIGIAVWKSGRIVIEKPDRGSGQGD